MNAKMLLTLAMGAALGGPMLPDIPMYHMKKGKPKERFPDEVLEKLASFPQTREGIKAKKAYLKSLKEIK